jgi:hypothetical protein
MDIMMMPLQDYASHATILAVNVLAVILLHVILAILIELIRLTAVLVLLDFTN